MKKVIINPLGDRYEFSFDDFKGFQARFFAVLAGIPKKVTLICDESVNYDEIYKIEIF